MFAEHREGHAKLAELLFVREVILAGDIEKIFGKRLWASHSQEIMQDNKPKLGDMPEEVKAAEEEHQRTLKESRRGS